MVRSSSVATLSARLAAASPVWGAVSAALAYLLARRERGDARSDGDHR